MKRFLRYWSPQKCEILHPAKKNYFFYRPRRPYRGSQGRQRSGIKKKRRRKKLEGERPASFAIERYLTGIVTSLEFGTGTTDFGVGVCLAPEGRRVQP